MSPAVLPLAIALCHWDRDFPHTLLTLSLPDSYLTTLSVWAVSQLHLSYRSIFMDVISGHFMWFANVYGFSLWSWWRALPQWQQRSAFLLRAMLKEGADSNRLLGFWRMVRNLKWWWRFHPTSDLLYLYVFFLRITCRMTSWGMSVGCFT